ncbi:membrane protein [Streptomyces sp. WM6373]|uniref:MFS transporter n=1 Tax=Streptomyces TaxID=1883 RepID=UPI0006AEB8EE|nr:MULTISPECIES: MFS transporter [unclassified Streptomyces]KOU30300.1 membrane protein [Streptomyces sp. WM6373]KOU63618.1 membrane protein [Streptomyces sp. IGB124]KOU70862.1 membrane protein [Streptomyces sp. XY66]KOU97593.1 membrane protein [Streptomyces sp. XY58]KOV02417.1 membrane protein [Streptomyces sp. XY37]
MNAEGTRAPTLLDPLRKRNFRCLAGGRMATYFANAMAPIVLSFAVLDLTGSLIDLGIVVGARSVANVALLLFGGVIADRLPRRLVLQGSSVAAGLAQAVIAASVLLGFASIPVLVVISVINGMVSALSLPAAAALVPQTVPHEMIRPANAVVRMAVNAGMVLGASTGGIVVGLAGPGWGIAVNAAVFLLAGLCFAGLRAAGTPAAPAGPARPLAELREGWKEFTSRTWVWVVVLQFLVINAVVSGGLQVLGPTIADQSFGRTTWGLLLAAQTAGAFAGGFLAARTRPRHALRIGAAVGAFEAVPLLALGTTSHVALLVAAMFINGVALEQLAVAWDVSLQENIPQERLARVYSYDALGSFVAIPIGEVAAGPVALHAGIDTTLVTGAVLVVAATGLALCSSSVRRLTVKPAAPPHLPAGEVAA